ncbi:hypothetical protein K8I28_12125 [bacterium]|nr:hypothetical protein [bacterium]
MRRRNQFGRGFGGGQRRRHKWRMRNGMQDCPSGQSSTSSPISSSLVYTVVVPLLRIAGKPLLAGISRWLDEKISRRAKLAASKPREREIPEQVEYVEIDDNTRSNATETNRVALNRNHPESVRVVKHPDDKNLRM